MSGFNPISNPPNTNDDENDNEAAEYMHNMTISPTAPTASSPRSKSRLTVSVDSIENPTEEDFINLYFKDKDTNENIFENFVV